MSLNLAIIGAGMAGITAARTLAQAGHRVQVFEQGAAAGGRMATLNSPHGDFDAGVQYFTVRDARFSLALQSVPGTSALCRPWSANAVRVLDPLGHVLEAARITGEAHFVASPGMDRLLRHWAAPLGKRLHTHTRVHRLARDDHGLWTVCAMRDDHGSEAVQEHAGFHAVLLAVPPAPARQLLRTCSPEAASALLEQMAHVSIAPCWTLILAFPRASQPGLPHLGPQWNAARSTHHRIAWLARESSKPGRSRIERWTVQASAEWSREHLEDGESRVQAKLLRAFAELTGIHAEPGWLQVQRWREAKTEAPLGVSHQYDAATGLGTCGDWHLGHRVEDAFVSGLELALQVCASAGHARR